MAQKWQVNLGRLWTALGFQSPRPPRVSETLILSAGAGDWSDLLPRMVGARGHLGAPVIVGGATRPTLQLIAHAPLLVHRVVAQTAGTAKSFTVAIGPPLAAFGIAVAAFRAGRLPILSTGEGGTTATNVLTSPTYAGRQYAAPILDTGRVWPARPLFVNAGDALIVQGATGQNDGYFIEFTEHEA